ncbi:MAG: MSMEG_4193 family putative phosphomutase [Caldilineae bacterium]|nr:MAG: MSMEG_4193 family putative phosphomutase [Caldilineae bacterium]
MSTTLLLVRHGENDWVKAKRLAGRTPGVHLNDNGRAQARRLAARLAHWPLTAVYSSPLERCAETATILARPHGLTVQWRQDLLEADIGEWQGKEIKELNDSELWRLVQFAPSAARFPGGETIRTMQTRIVDALHDIAAAHPDQCVAICSHSDPIKAALAQFLGMHLDLFQRIHISPASVSVVLFGKFGPRVLRINDNGQLDPPPREEEQKPDS